MNFRDPPISVPCHFLSQGFCAPACPGSTYEGSTTIIPTPPSHLPFPYHVLKTVNSFLTANKLVVWGEIISCLEKVDNSHAEMYNWQ